MKTWKGKIKYYGNRSTLYKVWREKPTFEVEVIEKEGTKTYTHLEHAFEYNGKMYAVIHYFPKNLVSFRFLSNWIWLFKLLNKRAWTGIYLRELKEV